MSDHSYDRRINYCTLTNWSAYTDDVIDVVLAAINPEVGLRFTSTGYADYEDVSYGHPEFRGIEGTIITRRSDGGVCDIGTVMPPFPVD